MAAPAAPPNLFDKLERAASGDQEMLRQLLATVGSFSVRLVVAGLILAFTLWAADRLAKLTARSFDRIGHHNHPADRTLSDFISALVRYLVIAIGAVAVLQQLGVQATSVLAVLGAASLAIGLALQGTLSNVAAGVMILLLRPYRVGDRVELNGKPGKVAHLDLFNTRVLDYDGLTVHLPNSKVFGDTIVNLSQAGRRRITLTVGVGYDDDLDIALALLVRLAKADKRVRDDPEPSAKVTALGDSSVSITLHGWTTPDDWGDVHDDLLKAVKETFEREGLSFPYPHQVSIEGAVAKTRPAKKPRPAPRLRADV